MIFGSPAGAAGNRLPRRPVASLRAPEWLRASVEPLCSRYDVALLDLDGVVYVGARAVPGAPEILAAVSAAGMKLAFVTNNASRTPETVAEHLVRLDIPAEPGDVTTSAQAASRYLAERLGAGARVLVLGTTGLVQALTERGLVPVYRAEDEPDAVVQGFSPDLDWKMLAEGARAVRSGLIWIATNGDATVPSPRGLLPGNGALVAALSHATGAVPIFTGKPDPVMHRETIERSGARNPLVVGDRLDTDIQGAAAVGCHSLLVLSGVTTPAQLVDAEPGQRPDFIAADVGGLLSPHVAPTIGGGPVRCGPWVAEHGRRLTLRYLGSGPSAPGAGEDLDALRALCAATWNGGHHGVSAGDEHAEDALERLSLL